MMRRAYPMTEMSVPPFSAFAGPKLLASGPLAEVAIAIKIATGAIADPIVIFDNATGKSLDIDLRGSHREVVARLPQPTTIEPETDAPAEPRGRGRPKLGVVAREITLLPRHWDWLGAQPGGASVALRKLVENARCCLSLHVDHGRRSAGLRGSVARAVCRRSTALHRTHRELASRYPRSHRNTRIS
jgi:hypothetical protein